MKGVALATGMAVLLAGPALSLSCLTPDIARDYRQAEASEDIWIVVDGVLEFDERLLPSRDVARGKSDAPHVEIAARIDGQSLSENGFTRAFRTDITLRVLCLGPWCGGARSGSRYLSFLKKEGSGYVMIVDPCGSMNYQGADDALRNTVLACFQGKACEPDPF